MVAPRELDPSTPEGMFGFEVRRLRVQAGLSQEQLGALVYCTGPQVSQTETAARVATVAFAKALDDALSADGMLVRLHGLIKQDPYPSWAREFVQLEARAIEIRTYENQLIPGLLQTEEYMRALIRAGRPLDADETVETLVAARLDRQRLLTSDTAPVLWHILDEAVLRRPVGTSTTMRDQFARLIEIGNRPNVIIQVLPFSAGVHAAMGSTLTIMKTDDAEMVAYIESMGTGHLIALADEVRRFSLAYDLVSAEALPQGASARMITSAMEGLL
ncbi:helix-turn-helix domain-containing protein [Catenulispora sp. NF23]|uniref:helix-turn-helix domain-containing protein n=1 Tax=Catenulispora pinistramenti TaxID=2705254 RepID=UPI001BAAABFF|nr:helix-turn-helix transcriptional regulator [Catenulispora pinistramenti]MBS2533871.1 helix-turn-helix domain-containing protein [Catenulispora pinistramenti]